MEIDIVSPGGWSVIRSVEPAKAHFLWVDKDRDNRRMPLSTVVLHRPECETEAELTLEKLSGRHGIACSKCTGILDLVEETTRCLIWVGYRCPSETGLTVEPNGVIVCLRSDRQPPQELPELGR